MTDQGQLPARAAEIYDEFFVPALFGAWPARVADAAGIEPGMHAVDVACGTGILAIEAAHRVGPEGRVTGIDLNPGMLAVARRKHPGIDWHEAPAENLPLADAEADAVVSQFGLMFFADRAAAIGEMWRVLRPGGRLAVAVWDALEHAPGYAAVVELLDQLFGREVADLLRAPYSLGDVHALESLFLAAGIRDARVTRSSGEAHFPSIRAWAHTDVRGWTLADKLDDEQFERFAAAAEIELHRFVSEDGTVRFPHPALIVTATKE
ncbi:MAG TPA: methyltransferase domain-containing protein [Steroidobacteraceae bacterium]|nr:methyltransferase domain-containing protein [Steroidobacteraceae bacterium]